MMWTRYGGGQVRSLDDLDGLGGLNGLDGKN